MTARTGSLAAGAICLALGSVVAAPAAQANMYEGKTVIMIVPHSPSGMYAAYSQLLAPAIARHLGAQEVRIEHQTGAGGLRGSNMLWYAEPDGMTFGLTSGISLMLSTLAGAEGAQFVATDFTYLGRPTKDDRVIFVAENSDLDSIEDVVALDRPFVVPSQGVDDDFYGMAMVADALGFDVRYVTGFEGGADTTLAVIRGDVDGRMTSWTSAIPPIQNGDGRPILSISEERHPDFPDVPTVLEAVTDPEKRAIVRGLLNIQALHRSFIAPPNTDPEATALLRTAIMAALEDPEVQEQAARLGASLDPLHGDRQQQIVAEIFEVSGGIPPILKAAVESLQ